MEKLRHASSTELRRRPTSQVDGLDLAAKRINSSRYHLRHNGVYVFGDGHLTPDRDGEVAVGAAPPAEWDVNVDVRPGVHGAVERGGGWIRKLAEENRQLGQSTR